MRAVKKSKKSAPRLTANRVRQQLDRELNQQIEHQDGEPPPPRRDSFVEMDPALRRPS